MSTLPKPFGYEPAAPASDVIFRLQDADPPSPLYIQRDDRLVLQGSTALGSPETITLTARLLLASPPGPPIDVRTPHDVAAYKKSAGQSIVTITQNLALAPLAADNTVVVDLAEGYLLSVAVACSNALTRGSTFARVWIQRGSLPASPASAALVLLADYVAVNGPQTWPGGRVIMPSEGSGFAAFLAISAPAAGADFLFTGATNKRMRLQSIRAQLVTAVAVANRTPKLQIREVGGNIVFESGNNNAQVASTTINYCYAAGCSPTQVDPTTFLAPLPDNFHIGNQFTIRSVTTNLQAADQWSAGAIQLEQWAELI